MAKVPLSFPFGGRLDSTSHTDNPQLYTRFARNVRARDPRTGRIRGASRAGYTKFNESAIGSGGRIRALVSTAIDDRKLSYTFDSGDVSELWSRATPSKTNSIAGRVDSQGNVYALDGPAGIVKFNSAGKQVMKIALPVADQSHVVRALWVDEAGRIFAGVSEGGDVRTARVFCVLQLEDDQYTVLWTLTPGAYTESLRLYRGSQLFAAHNYPLENRARVLIYEGVGLEPTEAGRIESVAYPIHEMDVLDGAVYCCSGDNRGDANTGSSSGGIPILAAYRPGHPGARGSHPPITAWTPLQLDNALTRIHAWYDAADIDETDLEQSGSEPTLDEGQQILRWRDKSGHERHWYAGSLFDAGEVGPTYSKVGPGGLPAVRFTNVGTTKQSMVTFGNASISKTTADQQRTAIPAHEGAMWAMFILLRPTVGDVAGTDPRIVFYAENDATTGAPGPHGLWVNRACGATQPGTFQLGRISYFAKTDNVDDGACATADQAAADAYTNSTSRFTDCVLVTIVWDGGIDPNDTTKTRCTFRVNGRPVDRFEGLAFESLKANYLAYAPTVATAVANRLNGEICEILSIGRMDRLDDVTEPKILTHDLVDFVEDFPGGQAQTDNEMTRIESYILHRRGLGHLLGGIPGAANPAGLWPHPYQQDDADTTSTPTGPSSPPDYDGAGRNTALEQVLLRYPLTTKHNEIGQLVWTCNENTHPDTGNDRGGIGWAVRARKIESDELVHVWMAGPDAVAGGDVAARKVIDQGASFSGLSADGAWRHKFAGNPALDYEHPRMDADKFGNLYFPGYDNGAQIHALTIFSKDGSGGAAVVRHTETLSGLSDLAYACAIPPDSLTPDYRTDIAEPLAEHVYVFTTALASTFESVYKFQLVTSTPLASGSPRTIHTIAVESADVRVITDVSDVVASGGSGVIDTTSQYLSAFRAGDDIIIIDGVRYWAYSLRDGTVSELVSTSAGEIPPRAKLGMYWRHRLVLGAFADAPSNYAASRLGRIRDWNLNPGSLPSGEQIHTSTQAFTGTVTRAGEAEEPLTCMISVWDDLAYMCSDSRILRLTGDPQDGGNIHKVTDSMGCAWDAQCKDAQGRVFIFGTSPPGLYQLLPDSDPVPLSRHTIEETEFRDIDFSTHRIHLAWNPIDKGVHIFQVAWGSTTVVDHWFWEERTHRLVRQPPIWTDRFYSAEKQPTATAYFGGDDSRGLLIGCADGYVRKWDPDAVTDDGDPIFSQAMMKVTPGGGPVAEFLMREVQIALADDQSGCRCEVFGSETADTPGSIVAAQDLGPGLNESFRVRLRAPHLWVRLTNAAARSWAFESGVVDVQARGKPVPSSP